jgi:phospholipase C
MPKMRTGTSASSNRVRKGARASYRPLGFQQLWITSIFSHSVENRVQSCNQRIHKQTVPSARSELDDIERVVIFIQENRSFDHYFGSYRDVRGFSDQSLMANLLHQAEEKHTMRKR